MKTRSNRLPSFVHTSGVVFDSSKARTLSQSLRCIEVATLCGGKHAYDDRSDVDK